MDEDYEICVKEMRAFFEKPRKLGVLPRMVKVRKDGERDPLQRKSSSSSDVLSVASSSSSSSSGNSSGSLSPSPPPTDSCSPSLESIQQKADEIEVVDLLPTATGTGGDANNKPAPPPEHRQRHKSSQDSECSSDEFLGASSDSSSSASSTTNNGAHSDDAASAASDDDDRHSGGLGVSMLGDLGGKNVVVCYRGPYIEQEEEREVLCNINNAFLTKKKLTQAQQMLKLLRTAEKGILANREDLERRVAEAAEQLQEQRRAARGRQIGSRGSQTASQPGRHSPDDREDGSHRRALFQKVPRFQRIRRREGDRGSLRVNPQKDNFEL